MSMTVRGPYTRYSPRLATMICSRISNGANLRRLCSRPGMPSASAAYKWMRVHPEFRAMYETAREHRTSLSDPEIQSRPIKFGHPELYSTELADRICDRIAAGASLTDLGEALDLPSSRTIYRWLKKYPEFQSNYAAACEQRADLIAEEALRIADDKSDDHRPNAVQRSKVQIDARKWRFVQLSKKASPDRADRSGGGRGMTYEEALFALK